MRTIVAGSACVECAMKVARGGAGNCFSRISKPSACSALNQSVAHRIAEEANIVLGPDLLHEPRLVRAHSLDGETERFGDLGNGLAGNEGLQHLELAVGKQRVRRGVGLRHRAERELLGHLRADVGTAGGDFAQRRSQFTRRAVLREVAGRTGTHRAHGVFMLLVHAKHHDARPRAFGTNLLDELDAAAARHGDVQDRHVEVDLARELYRFHCVGRVADDLEIARGLEKLAQSFPDDRVIVGDQHSDHADVVVTVARGMRTSSRVPRPGALVTRASPPRRYARSRTPSSPYDSALRGASVAKPTPSSCTVTLTLSRSVATATSTCDAFACLPTFVSDSCTIRNTAEACATGSSRSSPGSISSHAMLLWRPNSLTSDLSAAASPRSSRSSGRRSAAMRRMAAIVVSICASMRSSRFASAPSKSAAPARMRVISILSADIDWASSSWSSRAILLCSCSRAEIAALASSRSSSLERESDSSACTRSVTSRRITV